MKKTVLLTFGRSFPTLTSARIFAAAGHRVIVVDSVDYALSKYSNAVDTFYSVSSPLSNPTNYVDELVSIAEIEKVDLVIPMWEDLYHIILGKEKFPKECTVFCPEFSLYHELLNKWTFQLLLEKLEIPHPMTYLVKDTSDLHRLPLTKPYAIKPVYSRASQFITKLIPGRQVPSLDIQPHNPWVAQEWIEGKSYCTYSVCREGKLLAHSTYPVKHTVDGHCCLTFHYIENKKIVDWIKDFIKKIHYTGQIAFDFIESHDGTLHAIECNPRSTSGLMLFERHQGLDQVFSDHRECLITPRKKTRRQIATGMAMYAWRKKGFLFEFLKTRDVILSRRDPIPFFMQPYIFFRLFFESRKAKMSIPNYFIHDHIWDGQ